MKKLLSVILAVLMLIAMVPAVYAATPTITASVDKTSVSAGDVVTLTAKVSANSNLCSLEYEVYYDTSAFQYVSGSVSCKGVFDYESHNETSGKIKFLGASTNGITGASKTLFTVRLKALKSSGTISVAVTEAYTANGLNETNVTSSVNSASAKTFTYTAGYLKMRSPSETTIRYKDGIVLHADTLKALPSGSRIVWTASNNNFKITESSDGKSLTVVSNSNGDTTFTATLYSSKNVVLDSVSVELTSKAGFFDKIGGFFRGLFGLTKIYAE